METPSHLANNDFCSFKHATWITFAMLGIAEKSYFKMSCLKIEILNFRFLEAILLKVLSNFNMYPKPYLSLLIHLPPPFWPIVWFSVSVVSTNSLCSITHSLCGQIYTFANNFYITITTYVKFDSYKEMINSQVKLYVKCVHKLIWDELTEK